MRKNFLVLVLITMFTLPCLNQTLAQEALQLEGEVITGDKGGIIGYGLKWNPIDGTSEYTIRRYGKDNTREVFIVDGGETSYADTSVEASVGYEYFVTSDRLISNIVKIGILSDDITAVAVGTYDYISIRFSKSEPYINVEKKIKLTKETYRKPYYLGKDGKAEKIRPIEFNNTCFLPIRAILDELADVGGDVHWDEKTRTATLNFEGNTVTITILSDDKQTIAINNELKQELDEMVLVRNNRLFFSVEVINLLAGKTIINRSTNWIAFKLVYIY